MDGDNEHKGGLAEDERSRPTATERTRRGASRTKVRRRPSGEPASLPRKPLAGSGKVWLPLGLVTLAIFALLLSSSTFLLA